MAFPTNVGSGRVVGRFLFGVVDGPDEDEEPDYIPAKGTITFAPSIPYAPNPTAVNGPVTIAPAAITGVLDNEGYLCTPGPEGPTSSGYRGVRLFATDDEDLLVKDWTWQVTYRLSAGQGLTASIPSHGIAVPEGETVDLTTAIKVPATTGYGLAQAEAALLRAEAAVQDNRGLLAAAQAAAGLVGAPAGAAVKAAISEGGAARAELENAIDAASGGAKLAVSNAVGEYAWNYPMAMYRDSPASRTYFGASDTAGNLLACYFDHDTNKARRQVVGTATAMDDHHIPVPSVPEGAPQLWVWTNHNRDSNIFYRVGDRTGDLETLGPVRTLDAGGAASYAAIIRNPADPLEVWMLNRTRPLYSPYDWSIRKGTINEAGKSVSWDARKTFVLFTVDPIVQGYVTVAPVALDGGDYGFRFAITGNPSNGDFHDVLYGTVNLVTGAVDSPGKTLTANVKTGAGLPMSVDDLAVIYEPPAGNTTRLFAVRDAGDPAVLVGTWDPEVPNSDVEYLHVERQGAETGEGLLLPSGGAYATRTPSPELQAAQDISLRMVYKPSAPTQGKQLMRRFTIGGTHVFQLGFLSTGKIRFTLYPQGQVTGGIGLDSTEPVPDMGESLVGVRIDIDTTNNTATYYTSQDEGAWTRLGDVKSQPGLEVFVADLPLSVSTTTGGIQGSVQKVEILSLDEGTTYLSQDFRESANGWVLEGSAEIDLTTEAGSTSESLGVAGQPYGMADSSRYTGGLAYPTPSKGTVIYRARENANIWYLEKMSKESGVWETRILDESTSHILTRPCAIENQGPLETVYTAFSSYTGFTMFEGDYRGI